MYAIVGASGNTGGVVAERLLQAGQKVRVIGRDAGRLERFTSRGADAGPRPMSATWPAARPRPP